MSVCFLESSKTRPYPIHSTLKQELSGVSIGFWVCHCCFQLPVSWFHHSGRSISFNHFSCACPCLLPFQRHHEASAQCRAEIQASMSVYFLDSFKTRPYPIHSTLKRSIVRSINWILGLPLLFPATSKLISSFWTPNFLQPFLVCVCAHASYLSKNTISNCTMLSCKTNKKPWPWHMDALKGTSFWGNTNNIKQHPTGLLLFGWRSARRRWSAPETSNSCKSLGMQ